VLSLLSQQPHCPHLSLFPGGYGLSLAFQRPVHSHLDQARRLAKPLPTVTLTTSPLSCILRPRSLRLSLSFFFFLFSSVLITVVLPNYLFSHHPFPYRSFSPFVSVSISLSQEPFPLISISLPQSYTKWLPPHFEPRICPSLSLLSLRFSLDLPAPKITMGNLVAPNFAAKAGEVGVFPWVRSLA